MNGVLFYPQSHQRYLSLLMEAICGEAEDVRRVRESPNDFEVLKSIVASS